MAKIMEHIITKTLSAFVATLLLSASVVAQEQPQEQVTLGSLLDRYTEQQRVANVAEDPQSEIRKLRSQIIDLRVERDALAEENEYLKNILNGIEETDEKHPQCVETECVSVDTVENERILSYVVYSLSLYRMAEVVVQNTPVDVEAHKKAQLVMAGVKSDLDTLGFDTTNMTDYPSLEELLGEMQIANKMR